MKIYLIIAILIILPVVYSHPCDEKNFTYLNTTQIIKNMNDNYCNISLSLETYKNAYKNGEKIEIFNKLSNKNYSFIISYWIEALNNTIIKTTETTNTNPKQYTPKLTENTTLLIKNNLTFINCNNTSNSTSNEIPIFIEVEKSPISTFTLEKLYINRNKKIEIGKNLTASISAYTGNLTNMSIKMQIKNITQITESTLENQFNLSTFNMTLDIPLDCNITTGTYPLLIESLNQKLTQNITVKNNCEEIEVMDASESNQTIIEFNIEEDSDESIINSTANDYTGMIVYKSSNQKARDIASYLGMIIMAVIVVTILLSKDKTEKTLKETTEKWSSQLEQQ